MPGLIKGLQPYSPKWKNHGTGGGTSFTLDVSSTTNATILIVGGVVQLAGSDYTVSGQTITTSSSVSSGVQVISAVLYDLGSVTTPAAGSVNFDSLGFTSQAQGDILYRDSSTWARLPAGTAGQFLKTQGAGSNPVWGAGDGGGAWQFIETLTASASSSLDFESLNSSSYTSYMFILESILPSSANSTMRFRMGTGSPTVTYDTGANYDYGQGQVSDDGGGNVTGGNFNQSYLQITDQGYSSNSDDGVDGTAYLYHPYNSARNTQVIVDTVFSQDTTDDLHRSIVAGRHQSAATVTGLRFYPSAGNFTSGSIHCYGLTQ